MKIFSGSINPNFASKVCDHLGCEYSLSKIKIDTFKDGETRIIIEESIRQEDCFVIQPGSLELGPPMFKGGHIAWVIDSIEPF